MVCLGVAEGREVSVGIGRRGGWADHLSTFLSGCSPNRSGESARREAWEEGHRMTLPEGEQKRKEQADRKVHLKWVGVGICSLLKARGARP